MTVFRVAVRASCSQSTLTRLAGRAARVCLQSLFGTLSMLAFDAHLRPDFRGDARPGNRSCVGGTVCKVLCGGAFLNGCIGECNEVCGGELRGERELSQLCTLACEHIGEP